MKLEMYSTHAEKYDLVIRDNIYNAHFERPSLQAILGDLNGLNVLDLGCGSGVYAQYLLEHGAELVTCVDVSEEMIGIVSKKFSDKVVAYTQDIGLGLPEEPSEKFDVIISPLVLHYIEDLDVVFKEASRVLKSGGYMAFSTHHPFADYECSKSGNYFEREAVFETWGTVGEPVEVEFYRRSLTEIMEAITNNGLVVSQISEGKVSDKVKTISQESYDYLSKKPNFIFIKCEKRT